MPRSKKYGNNYWNSTGPKVGLREVILYSDLEFDHWLHIETDPDIVTYCEQFKEIPYVADDKLRSTIFDMWLKYRDGREAIHEVKYESELIYGDFRNARTLRQIEAQKQWCNQHGIEYKVVTEKTIRSSPLELENKVSIVSFIKNDVGFKSTIDIRSLLSQGPLNLSAIAEQLNETYTTVRNECLWHLYKGHIRANLSQSILGIKTEVWINEPL